VGGRVEARGGNPGPPGTLRTKNASLQHKGILSDSVRFVQTLWTRNAPVVESFRLFNCARCHCQIKICTWCDRGNVYCPACAVEAKLERLRRAGGKYQRTPRGRLKHAARQRSYLVRRKKMTHRGSPKGSLELPLRARPASKVRIQSAGREEVPDERESEVSSTRAVPLSPGSVRCDFCGRLCGEFARRAPIRRRGTAARIRRRPRPPGHRRPAP